MRRTAWILLSLSLMLLGAVPASAGTLTVDYDLRQSTLIVDPLGGLNDRTDVPIRVRGSLRLTLTDVDADGFPTAQTPLVRISDLTLTFDLDLFIAGSIRITQAPDPSAAVLLFDRGLFRFQPSGLVLPITGRIDCVVSSCVTSPSDQFPIVLDTILGGDLPTLFSFNVGPGEKFIGATLRGMRGTQPLELRLFGTETARTFVPEPTGVGLLSMGILALGLVRGPRRRKPA